MTGASHMSRRSFMKTLSGIGAAGLYAGLLRDAWAATASPEPPRFCVLHNPHGYAPKYWRPRAPDGSPPGETGWTLDFPNSSLSPLEKHKDSLVIIEGLDLASDYQNRDFFTGGHNSLSVLTGMHPLGGENTPGQYKSCGPSIDHYLAQRLDTSEFLFKATGYAGGNNTMGAYRADGSAITAEYDLSKSLTNWFGSVTSAIDPKAAATKDAQRAVVSYLSGEGLRLRSRLAGPERYKLDAHLDALNAISRRLETVTSLSCARPSDGSGALAGNLYMPIILQFAAQLFACNLTRVVNLSIDPINSGKAPWLASVDPFFETAGIHDDVAHRYRPEDDNSQRLLSLMHRWYAEQVSYFIDLLKAIPEGTGSAYDNTIILWVNELGDPARHMHNNLPFVLAGGGGSYAKGRYLGFNVTTEYATSRDAHTPLLTSLANQYGANLTAFGDAAYPGELPGLL